jgi:hypothetical protein
MREMSARLLRPVLGLRLEKQKPAGRLEPSRIHETIRLQINLTSPADMDSEVLACLPKAYDENL